jgi:diacylglycerol O-acyltransferase / wax synthase
MHRARTTAARDRTGDGHAQGDDLPGPPEPLYLAGAQLLELFPLVNLVGNQTLGVAALSYAGQFDIMTVADVRTCPDAEVFAAGVEAELQVLEATTRPVER